MTRPSTLPPHSFQCKAAVSKGNRASSWIPLLCVGNSCGRGLRIISVPGMRGRERSANTLPLFSKNEDSYSLTLITAAFYSLLNGSCQNRPLCAAQARSKPLPINKLLTTVCSGPACPASHPVHDLAGERWKTRAAHNEALPNSANYISALTTSSVKSW